MSGTSVESCWWLRCRQTVRTCLFKSTEHYFSPDTEPTLWWFYWNIEVVFGRSYFKASVCFRWPQEHRRGLWTPRSTNRRTYPFTSWTCFTPHWLDSSHRTKPFFLKHKEWVNFPMKLTNLNIKKVLQICHLCSFAKVKFQHFNKSVQRGAVYCEIRT